MNLAQRRKRTIVKSIYLLAILSFVVVVIWIGLEVYFAYTNSPEEIIEPALLEPIEVNLYVELAEQLNQREKFDNQTLESFANTLPSNQTISGQGEELTQTSEATNSAPISTQIIESASSSSPISEE